VRRGATHPHPIRDVGDTEHRTIGRIATQDRQATLKRLRVATLPQLRHRPRSGPRPRTFRHEPNHTRTDEPNHRCSGPDTRRRQAPASNQDPSTPRAAPTSLHPDPHRERPDRPAPWTAQSRSSPYQSPSVREPSRRDDARLPHRRDQPRRPSHPAQSAAESRSALSFEPDWCPRPSSRALIMRPIRFLDKASLEGSSLEYRAGPGSEWGTRLFEDRDLSYSADPMGAESASQKSAGSRAATRRMTSPVNWTLLGLVLEQPGYGYQLVKRFEHDYGDVLPLSSDSHIYTALNELERRGFVEVIEGVSKARLSQVGTERQPRLRYRATVAGVHSYGEYLHAQVWRDRRQSRLFLRQLAVFAEEPDVALEILDRCEQALLKEASSTRITPPDDPYAGKVSGLAARLIGEESRLAMEGRLPWIEYARDQFRALGGGRGDAPA
jgi:DNA-binding PadR family transcriptional regulator